MPHLGTQCPELRPTLVLQPAAQQHGVDLGLVSHEEAPHREGERAHVDDEGHISQKEGVDDRALERGPILQEAHLQGPAVHLDDAPQGDEAPFRQQSAGEVQEHPAAEMQFQGAPVQARETRQQCPRGLRARPLGLSRRRTPPLPVHFRRRRRLLGLRGCRSLCGALRGNALRRCRAATRIRGLAVLHLVEPSLHEAVERPIVPFRQAAQGQPQAAHALDWREIR
mmetsp:Transcript_111982/g.323582  ORF Transcript_111982/g.323582 Transcript_111982/m.323582 type:complete len:225 (-) Transcript_111982:63-737(-)